MARLLSCTALTTQLRVAAMLRTDRKVKSTLHWVNARHAIDAEVRLYDHLFTKENPEEADQASPDSAPTREGKDFTANLNPNSLEVLTGCKVEPSLKGAKALQRFQFERLGYFCVDPDSSSGKLIFNRTVTLKDEWAKIQSASSGLNV